MPVAQLNWQSGTVIEVVVETPRVKSIVLELPAWRSHRAGQHVDVRLTATDGRQALRSYSIASAPEDGYVVLTVERLAGGEVSPYLTDELRVGDQLELRGPIGAHFVWEQSLPGPLLLVAGGCGVAPLRAMLRHWAATHSPTTLRLLYSARSLEHIIYREELLRASAYDEVDVRLALTREWPDGWKGHRGRINGPMLADAAWPPTDRPRIYVCGSSSFVETLSGMLVEARHDPRLIRTERFGPSGR